MELDRKVNDEKTIKVLCGNNPNIIQSERAKRSQQTLRESLKDALKKADKEYYPRVVTVVDGIFKSLAEGTKTKDPEVEELNKKIYMTYEEFQKTELAQKYILERDLSRNGGRACIVIGLPGAGKTSGLKILEELKVLPENFNQKSFSPDPDDVKFVIPGFDIKKVMPLDFIKKFNSNYSITEYERDSTAIGSDIVHDCAVNIVDVEIEKALAVNSDIIYGFPGDDPEYLQKIIKKFTAHNYKEITLVYVSAEPDVCIDRVDIRYHKTGRMVPPFRITDEGMYLKKPTDPHNVWPRNTFREIKDQKKFNTVMEIVKNWTGESINWPMSENHVIFKFALIYSGGATKKPILVEKQEFDSRIVRTAALD